MSTFSGRGLHGQVLHELGVRIMRGGFQPGEIIDPDALMSDFNVSRTVLREAFKVLSAKGLLDARPRLGTFVTERSRWQLLDAEVMNWRTQGEPDARLVRELDQVRGIIEPSAARLAAEHRSPEQLERIRVAFDALAHSYDNPEVEHADADIAFHTAVLAATGNELLERFQVVLEPALHARDMLAYRHATTLDFLDGHRAVFDAIADGDGDAAFERMLALMQQSASDTAAILKAFEAPTAN